MLLDAKLDDETGRIAALKRYEVLDTEPEPEFDSITTLVKSIFDVPYVTISLVDVDRQWFMSRQGGLPPETPRGVSFCHYTIQNRKVMPVSDASKDARLATNPLVTGTPHLRAYLGAPLRTPDGYNIGSLCVMDTKPRDFTDADSDLLAKFANLVVGQLELRQIARSDALTGALTRRGFEAEVSREVATLRRHGGDAALILFDLDHFKQINDTYGHLAGDAVLKATTRACHGTIRENDVLGRMGGEEFAVLAPRTGLQAAMRLAERIRAAIAEVRIPDQPEIRVTASFGVATCPGGDVAGWVAEADRRLYAAKRSGRNRCVSEEA